MPGAVVFHAFGVVSPAEDGKQNKNPETHFNEKKKERKHKTLLLFIRGTNGSRRVFFLLTATYAARGTRRRYGSGCWPRRTLCPRNSVAPSPRRGGVIKCDKYLSTHCANTPSEMINRFHARSPVVYNIP